MPDVVIVGGGIIGATCALELASRGASVTLVERDHLAAHASGRNQGLWVLPEEPDNLPMADLSLDAYRELARHTEVDFRLDTEPVGQILVANDPTERQSASVAVELARSHGVTVDELDSPVAIREAEAALNPDVAGAWLVHDGYRMDPGALTVASALAAADRGAMIRHHVFARALVTRDEAIVGVATDDGVIHADATIVAGGPWSHTLLDPVGVHLPIVGARGWIVMVQPEPHLVAHLIEALGPHAALKSGDANDRPTAREMADGVVASSAIGSLVHPAADGRTVLIGSSRQTWITPEPNDTEVVGKLLHEAIQLVPALADARVLSSWWGLRPLSPDERPFVGAVREGLHVATGHGSEGVILGAGTAKLVASQVTGEPAPFDPKPFDPFRLG